MKFQHWLGAVILAAALPAAHANLSNANLSNANLSELSCQDGSRIDTYQNKVTLQGAWVGQLGGITLLRPISEDMLELHGQDSEYYWDGRCQRSASDPKQFLCTGLGKGLRRFDSGHFSYQSTLTVSCDPIVEQWSIRGIANQEARHGTDVMVRIQAPVAAPKAENPAPEKAR